MITTAQQILESIPQRFRAEKAQGYNAVFHFDIYGEEMLQYTVNIKDGACTLEKGFIGTPDYIRDFEPIVNGVSTLYLALNRNKRSLAVNYLSAEGKQLVYDLAKGADVLVEQFRPGVMQGMGFGYEELKKLNPKLIYVSI